MQALYSRHAARTSIAGTVESISHITAQTLYDCHKAFYTPSNMILTVVGNVDPVRIREIAQSILPREGGPVIPRDYGEEPMDCLLYTSPVVRNRRRYAFSGWR